MSVKPESDQSMKLIIPVESQIREFEAKLLLACVAARRGLTVVIGRLKSINSRITSFPRSIYLAKGIAPEFIPTFKILHGLGHAITGWDEEALVHLPEETYFAKRMSVEAGHYVSLLFACGEENAELWLSSPHHSIPPIHITGNPRLDLLRPEMRSCFESDIKKHKRTYGDFFLVNTNFSMVNSKRSLFMPVPEPGGARKLGPAADGMARSFAERLERHKLDIFQRFQDMIPKLAQAFPNYNIVIRPHPSENPQIYHRLAADCERIHVLIEGNVVPWLLAAKALIHNGCTTAIEANLLGVPTVSFGPTSGEGHEFGRAWRLPDLFSHSGEDSPDLFEKLEKIVSGELGRVAGSERDKLMSKFLTSSEGPMACERIVDVLEEYRDTLTEVPRSNRLIGRIRAHAFCWRTAGSKLLNRKPRKAPEARRAVYHDFSSEHLCERLNQFQLILGDPVDLKTTKFGKYIYRIIRA